jgi:hypothetical protein
MCAIYKTTIDNLLYSLVPFPERHFKNLIIWREGCKGRININEVRRETMTVVWPCKKMNGTRVQRRVLDLKFKRHGIA